MTSKTEIAYAAGFFDGEGCITLSQTNGKYLRVEVSVSQKFPAVLHWFKTNFGGSIYQGRVGQWKIHGAKAVAFLRILHPYLIVKYVDVQETFEIWEKRHQIEVVAALLVKRRTRREQANQ